MPAEGFFKRWSRLKATGGDDGEPGRTLDTAGTAASLPASARAPAATRPPIPHAASPAVAVAGAPVPDAPAPTLEDAARLTPESDFSAFVSQGVDKSVQRLALKKLFADPHFKVMDGLDMYMDDYNIPSPVSAAMLASLDHARSALRMPDPREPEEGIGAPMAMPPGPADTPAVSAADAPPAGAPDALSDSDAASTPGATIPIPVAASDADRSALTDAHTHVEYVSALQLNPATEIAVDAYTPVEHSTGTPAVPGAAAIPAGPHPQHLQGQA
ncbi:DUF3306 domain-containing protein [Massilia sp. Dwa41.01b]|uniref:DUF3306 domain-containing protein n=1 Tax=Massilia sp. Dwa41.01b TaxID=2709302 RepID=UPI0015FF941A|nr:DUF3306 domain-containing protein [Massilia sp. Dwa41.01b]QNA89485.1 DUF3306 domain-containing protein [Massilia sp. Dwa41.01b]